LNKKFRLVLVALFLQSCATKTPHTDILVEDSTHLPKSFLIGTVPFIKQMQHHCGPASLAMILKANQRPVHFEHLTNQMMTPGKKGTFSTDVITAVRRQGMIPIRVSDLRSLLTEISFGQPIMVFQNLGFSWYPQWHYAVALGYDLSGPDIILHSGKNKFLKTDMRMFERSWALTKSWGLLILNPGTLSNTVDDLGHVAGISGLEAMEKFDEAKISYAAVLSKWPKSLPALIGMGNVLYATKDYKGSAYHLRKATEFHPLSETAWHNLATAQGANGQLKEAKESARRALSLVENNQAIAFQGSLREWLDVH
jgi:hypothetical protein